MYYLLPLKIRWIGLFAASVVFVVSAGWQSAAHLFIVALVMWLGGLGLLRVGDNRRRKWLLGLLLVIVLGAMMLIKYQEIFADLLKASLWKVALPLGLSYFTFQSAGYLVDVYRGKVAPQKNPLKAWLFLGYFPQLTQGPISTWKQLGDSLFIGHRLDPVGFVSGFQLLVWGYFKKLVIADRLAATTAPLLNETGALPGWFVVGGVALYTLRLYMDFSGGMDVVRGLSRMLGIELTENFRRPFFAVSVAEYWRRWHITLGAWFRSYLLYPLTTSRVALGLGKKASKLVGKKTGRVLPSALATVLVFVLVGLWHSANINALIYGAYFGLVMGVSMLLEPVWKTLRRTLTLPKGGWMKAFRLVRTWFLVLLAQYFAFTTGPNQGLYLLKQSFTGWNFSGFSAILSGVMPPMEWAIAGVGIMVVMVVDVFCECKVDVGGYLAKGSIWLRWPILLLLLLIVLLFGVYGAEYDATAFLYTQF